MTQSQKLLQDLIDIVNGSQKANDDIFLSGVLLEPGTKRAISKLLRWLFVQDFVGDNEVAEYDKSFSSEQVIQLINTSSELQRYFQIKDGKLAFADDLSEAEASEMLKYVKQHYQPQVNF